MRWFRVLEIICFEVQWKINFFKKIGPEEFVEKFLDFARLILIPIRMENGKRKVSKLCVTIKTLF